MTARLVGALVRIGLAIDLLALALTAARAHDWYPTYCCSGTDCHPTGEAEGAREPAATYTSKGVRLHDGKEFNIDDMRKSEDGLLHVCRRGGLPDGDVIYSGGKPCIFVPGFGS